METHVRIFRRSGHIAVAYKNNMIIWGGYMESSNDSNPAASKYHNSDEVWIYNTNTDIWVRGLTKGDIPPRSSGSCGVVFDDSLYVFGGYQTVDDLEVGNSNRLYKLNLNTLTWNQLMPEGVPPPPCDKLVGWLYNEKLYFFGGFGPNAYPNNSRYLYIMDTSSVNSDWPGRGWNNQFVCYNVATNVWEWPVTQGPKPGPRAAHAADICGSNVYIFGGRTSQVRNNELHVLDLKTMTWSGDLRTILDTAEWPEGRSWHSLTFISPNTAILYGGLNQYNVVLNDCWVLKISEENSIEWKSLRLPYDHGEPRCSHGACFMKCERLLFIHSGLTQPYYVTTIKLEDHADTVLIIPFSPKSLLRICLDKIIENDIIFKQDFQLPSTLINILEQRKQVGNNEITTIYYSES